MRVVIDGLSVLPGSNQLVLEHLLPAWVALDAGDELHLLLGEDAELSAPHGVAVRRVGLGRRRYLGRLRAQATVVPRVCREVGADIMLGAIPSTTVTPLPCPRAIIAWDLRHELRPAQFSRQARLLRRVSYEIGFRQADAIVTISERTRDDLLASRPWLGRRRVRPAQLGGDHVDTWPGRREGPDYALAFGQWGNKNVDLVIEAWARLHARGAAPALRIVGLGRGSRDEVRARLAGLGLGDIVETLPWLSDEEFRACVTSAAMIVFPSDFEGFGLPAVEAMRLGIPLVVTPDPALLEVTGGHAAVMAGWSVADLEDAVLRAQRTTTEQLAAAREHAGAFTWARTAQHTRAALAEAIAAR